MSKLLNIFILLLILAVICPASLPVQASTESENTLLQYTGGGHVLGFSEGEFYVVTGDHALKVEFVNSLAVQPVAESIGSGQNVAPLDKVTYNGIWKDIDIAYTSVVDGIAESTYYLNTPASVESIRLRYNRPVSLDVQGNLVISFEKGNMVESLPIAWQETAGHRTPLQANYVIYDGKEVGFALAGCQPGFAVTIDPKLSWNTFLGGNMGDSGNAIAVDAAGNIYVAGDSNAAWGNPIRAYSELGDAFVARLNNSGVLVWNTFLGGSERDGGNAIALDALGHIYVAGTSHGTWGSPALAYPGGLHQPFVACLSNSGVLQWNTFLGGGSWGEGRGIATDSTGSVYVTGASYGTWGSPVQAFSGYWNDAFAAKLNQSGTLQWNTFLGGVGDDLGYGIAVNAGNVYVVGDTDNMGAADASWGTPLRAYSGDDAFVAGLNNSGALQWNTFLGSNNSDSGNGIAVDAGGNVYVAGYSVAAWGNPVRAFSSNGDAYAAKLDSNGNLIWNSFLGGNGADAGGAIATDAHGNVYITGHSQATWGDPLRPFPGGDFNCFASALNSSGGLLWNTFLGGPYASFGLGVAVDPGSNVYVAGVSYGTWGSPVRPYTPGAGDMDTLRDAFVAKILRDAPIITSFTPASGDSGTVVSIAGNYFLGATIVSFGGTAATSFTVNSDTQITATVGSGTTGKITITTPSGTCTSAADFTFTSLISTTRPHGSSMPGLPAAPPQSPVILPTVFVKSASLSATKVAPGAAINVTADVVNTSTVNGSSSIKVYVNGELENSRGITVNSGSNMPVNFTVSRNEPGTYSVCVGGTQAGSFTVDQFADPNMILYISGALILLAFVIGVIYVTSRRQSVR